MVCDLHGTITMSEKNQFQNIMLYSITQLFIDNCYYDYQSS